MANEYSIASGGFSSGGFAAPAPPGLTISGYGVVPRVAEGVIASGMISGFHVASGGLASGVLTFGSPRYDLSSGLVPVGRAGTPPREITTSEEWAAETKNPAVLYRALASSVGLVEAMSSSALIENRLKCEMLRCRFPDPFRPRPEKQGAMYARWAGGRLRRMAAEARLGTQLQFLLALPRLADALEEAGCADPDLVAHLRSPGPHFDFCWAVAWVAD